MFTGKFDRACAATWIWLAAILGGFAASPFGAVAEQRDFKDLSATVGVAVAQWDFDGNFISTTGGLDLLPGAASPATAPGVTFSSVSIGGETATVASFSRGTWFRATHGLGVNGDGSFLNVYTLIMDVMFPSRPTGWAVLWQTSPANSNDGDWFINPSDGVGISGVYGGSVPNGTWHRLALVVDCVGGTLTSYINGTQAQQIGGLTIDGRWAIGPDGLLFADENQENAAGLVNSVQLRPIALSAADIATLGGPAAAGIPVPSLPTLQLLTPNGGESFQAGTTQLVSWAAENPSGLVQVDLYRGDSLHRQLGEVSMRQSNFNWVINSRIGDGTDYRILITSSSFPGVSDFSDAHFTISGSGPPANPLFGQPLQTNGGFEASLTNWQTILGNPRALTSTGGKGAPHSGSLFFHGGPGNSNAVIIRQEIDLIAVGFTAEDIDGGAVLDAEAWLRNWFSAGTFDDQIYYSVLYLGAAGDDQPLSSVRCMIAAHNAWLVRRLTGVVPAGTRRLRVEFVGKHRRDRDNDSMADDIVVRLQEGSGVVTPQITKLPMLQDVRPDTMTLLWETDGNLAGHAVEWGRSNVAENTFTAIETLQIDSTHFVHRATLTGLARETHYVYRVRSGTNITATFSFRTAPHRDTPFAVAWWGDNHQGTVTLRQHIANLSAHGPDFIAVAGDMVNNGNVLFEWHDYWFKPLEHLSLGQTKPIIFARGNHDGEHALAYAYSKLPGNEAWFAFDYGNTRFIFLDSEVDSAGSPEQLAWLRAELQRPETRQATFRIVCFHRPPWVNLWNGGGYTGEGFVRNDWTPLFAQGLVDMVICGHAHNYNRGQTNGVTYVITGGGGGILDVERVAFWPLFTVEYSRYHYGLMEVNGDTLLWEVYDNNNALLDTITLKSRTPSLLWASSTPNNTTLPLVISGRPGVSYVLEESADLLTWTTLSSNTMAANGWRTNSIAVNGQQRFFRARTQ